ncbi:MAG: cell envelope biogenesis protein OmpA [Deltaproteobacteria bacterium]|nr:MAG: cell envelope biogenesis protein OmpA [Deltaproteobacteria bacterium]
MLAPPADARELTRASRLDLVLFRPGPGATDFLGLRGGRMAPAWTPSLGLVVGTAARMLEVTVPTSGAEGVAVEQQLTVDVLAALAVTSHLELGVALPAAPLTVLGDGAGLLPTVDDEPRLTASLGDVRVSAKVRLPDPVRGLAAALDLTVALPTGGAYAGHDGVTVTPTVVLDGELGSEVRVVGNLGFAFRPERSVGPVILDDTFQAAVGVEVLPGGAAAAHAVRGEACAFVGLAEHDPEEVGGELRASYAYRATAGFELGLGVGLGIGDGVGIPRWRAFGGVRYRPGRCATGPEDVDGWEDDDGCGDPDNDGDGIDDAADLCPNEAESRNGFMDEDGCPDAEPGFTPFAAAAAAAATAAPAGDRDGDGLDDDADVCPDAQEDVDGFQDGDGCPEPDDDLDGIPDAADQCPRSAEVVNGTDDDDGCPDVATVSVSTEGIVLRDIIRFLPGSATLDHESDALLDSIAAILAAHPEILRLEVAGHTDAAGPDAANLALSQARADAVRAYLIGRGIAPGRLVAVGYGETRPIASNATPRGRLLNRRVELTVLELEQTPGNSP